MAGSIGIFHGDDDADFAALADEFLEREDARFSIDHVTSASDNLEYLGANAVDSVVSGYDMPGRIGIEFPDALRADHPDLPFILFPGKGSEEVASGAISAGVSDYPQKHGGTDQCTVLANRLRNTIEGCEIGQQRRQWKRAVETATEGMAILDEAVEISG